MLVSREQLSIYNIPSDFWFARRNGTGEPISRNQYFEAYPQKLVEGIYCAIGNDTDLWELEEYNGENWVVANVNPNYTLVITNTGLKKLTNGIRGTVQLTITGIKILENLITNSKSAILNWTDSTFTNAGRIVYSCGTAISPTSNPDHSENHLKDILSWRFNSGNGGLQYILTLDADETSDIRSLIEAGQFNIGTIGLYIKDPEDSTTDILFAVACLKNIITKHNTTVNNIGNNIKLNFNIVLSNIGYVSNLTVEQSGEQNIPEVPNESLLYYPTDPYMTPYNCYLVDSLNGSGIPALAVPKKSQITSYDANDWVFFQPSENFISVDPSSFKSDVKNYMFVYYNSTTNLYELAEGIPESQTVSTNSKAPMGIRIGNNIVFSGDITNGTNSYLYSVTLMNGGENYTDTDELLLAPVGKGIVFKVRVRVQTQSGKGPISTFEFLGPTSGNINILNGGATEGNIIIDGEYDPRSPSKTGRNAEFKISQIEQINSAWNFDGSWLNKPLYCGYGATAGMPVLDRTDSFVGWCTGNNSIRLALDLRNRASNTVYGTTRFATNTEVKDSITNSNAATQTSVTPYTLHNNYLQITKSTDENQSGDVLSNPLIVDTFVKFNNVIMGKGTQSPYNSTTNPNLEDASISFYGLAYRAWYEDIAEFYESDEIYSPGTLITFGKGPKEISIATIECNGIISSKPGYQLGLKKTENYLPVALTGRIPVLFDGYCLPKFGDKIYLSKLKKGYASTVENGKCLGKIIERNFGTATLIECVVRIDF